MSFPSNQWFSSENTWVVLGHFMLVCILLNVGGIRHRVRQELTNKIPKASTYQSSVEVEEGLTRDAMRFTETIWSYVGDEGLDTQRSIWVFIHTIHS
jgi:hypothetical protein